MLLHIDADAFFAAVEQAADVRLRGRPVAVGGEQRGVICSASYEARAHGVASAMPTSRARKLCPGLIVLPPNFELYELFSRRMFSYAHDFTPLVEVGSIDEGYLDLSGCRGKSPGDIGRTLRRAIHQSLKITVSEGIGRNKLVSQIASKVSKPGGFVEIEQGNECRFLHPLAADWLPGVGSSLAATFRTAGLTQIGHVAATPPHLLALLAGKSAARLHAFAHGEDPRPVIPDAPAARSYSIQETFEQDVTDNTWLTARLRVMVDTLMARVRSDSRAIRTVSLRLRYNDMTEARRSESLKEPADMEHLIYPLLPQLLSRAWERRVSVRLLSVRFSQVYQGGFMRELPLEGIPVADERRHRLACTVDSLRSAHHSILRGHDLWLQRRSGAPRPALIAQESASAARPSETSSRTLRERASSPEHRHSGSPAITLTALNVRSCYSFMDSLLTIPDIIATALERGCQSVALTDPNLHAAVPFYQAARTAGLHPVIGAELQCEGRPVLCYVENATGYQHLCQLLSLRDGARVTAEELRTHSAGLLLPGPQTALPEIRYAAPGDRQRYDILQSIRTLTLLQERHPAKRRNACHWPEAAEMHARCTPDALRAAADIAERCRFDFDLQTLRFPSFTPACGSTPAAMLRTLACEGLLRRYGPRAPLHQAQLDEELSIIGEVRYEEYFLTVHDILQECRTRGINWITRGSAADSLVCYCLEISGVCPIRFDLYFRRFLNRDRMALQKLPDIDIDFAHDRKDEVVELILARYGPQHSAIVGGFNTFQARSAVAEIAKVLGVSDRDIRTLTTRLPHTRAAWLPEALATSHLAQEFPIHEEPWRTALATAAFLDGFPRYAKMHPCGVIISRDPIHSLTPTFLSAKGWPTSHVDMDAAEAVGLIKLDILAQGGLAVIRDALAMLAERGLHPDLENMEPWQDPGVWEMIAGGQSRGVHHIESPAMCSLARMARVRDIDTLIAIVSVIRPGAANNLKKRQFCRRAQGLEPITYAHPSLESVLRSTFGVVAYEEHILQICEAFAGMDPGRADYLRRALVKMDARKIDDFSREFLHAAQSLGRTEREIQDVWLLLSGFQGYAFCRAHSTAYGVEAYQGAWLKHYHAPEFLAAVLSNGKGFYSPLAYSLECRRLGIQFRLPCVNDSRPGCHVQYADDPAAPPMIRLPLRAISGLTDTLHTRWAAARERRPFTSLADFAERVHPTPAELQILIRAGAFDTFGHTRPHLFWQARSLGTTTGEATPSLFPASSAITGLPASLPSPGYHATLQEEQALFGYTVSGHPLDLYPCIAWHSYCTVARLDAYPGQRVTVCGLIVEERLHRQSTGDIMKFITLCDYTGFIECEIFAEAYKYWGLATLRYPVVEVEAIVSVFDNARGYTLDVQCIRKPRTLPPEEQAKQPQQPADTQEKPSALE